MSMSLGGRWSRRVARDFMVTERAEVLPAQEVLLHQANPAGSPRRRCGNGYLARSEQLVTGQRGRQTGQRNAKSWPQVVMRRPSTQVSHHVRQADAQGQWSTRGAEETGLISGDCVYHLEPNPAARRVGS